MGYIKWAYMYIGMYIYLVYFSIIISFETSSPGFIIDFETLSSDFIIGLENSKLLVSNKLLALVSKLFRNITIVTCEHPYYIHRWKTENDSSRQVIYILNGKD